MKLLFTFFSFLLSLSLLAQDITTFPYSTGFEGAEGNLNENYPPNWTSEDLNTVDFGNQGWQIIKNTDLSINAHTDSTAVHMFSHPSEANNDWLYTPSVQMTAGNTYILTFWTKINSIGDSAEKLKVHVAQDNSSMEMLMNDPIWSDDDITNQDYEEQTAEFVAGESGTFYFGFHCFSDEFQFILLMDDVTIDESVSQSISDDVKAQIKIVNPVRDQLNVFLPENIGPLQMNVYSLDGRLILDKQLNTSAGLATESLSGMSKGNYIVELRDLSGSPVFKSQFFKE